MPGLSNERHLLFNSRTMVRFRSPDGALRSSAAPLSLRGLGRIGPFSRFLSCRRGYVAVPRLEEPVHGIKHGPGGGFGSVSLHQRRAVEILTRASLPNPQQGEQSVGLADRELLHAVQRDGRIVAEH